jgi:hypothetical protein
VRWTPEALAVTDANGVLYGGAARFSYLMAPLNIKDVTPTATFKTDYEDVDLGALSDLWKFDGIRLAGRASGSNLLAWPLRRYRDHTGGGTVRFTPPDEVRADDARHAARSHRRACRPRRGRWSLQSVDAD